MARLMQTLAGEATHDWNGAAHLAWLVHLDSVCSNCGASRNRADAKAWDTMWNTCAPCGRKLDYGSEQSMLPPECRDSAEEQEAFYNSFLPPEDEYATVTDEDWAAYEESNRAPYGRDANGKPRTGGR